MAEPKVSVVIPIYNGEKDLSELLTCLQAQTYPPAAVEYLLVNNNSQDRTLELLQTAAEHLTLSLQVLSENQIQSSYAARNAGLRVAQGEIIAFTDADCRPLPHWLANLMAPFSNPEIGIVAGEILALAGETLLERHASRQNTLSQKHTLAHPFCPYGQTANLAVRRTILEQVGLFRPYLTSGGDADLCWRILQQTPYKLKFAESAIVLHRHRSTWQELYRQWRRYGESNRYLHQLYGVDLMRDLTVTESLYRITRWLFKELPLAAIKAGAGQADLVDLFNTPIGIFNLWARSAGQQQAKLPEQAHQIERI